MHENLVSILVPVYNEKAYLRKCVNKILQAPLPDGLGMELILVDDASTDETRDEIHKLVAEYPDVIRPYFQQKNMGKGGAIRRAIELAAGRYIIFQDADLEYDPNEYPMLLKPILEGHADVVYGSRFMPREMARVLNYHHALGNKFLTHLSNFLTGLNLTDMETGYKVFKADVLKTIPIRSRRFGIEPEITAKIAKRNCVIYEVPISYYGRTYAEGKKINWKDGISAIYTIFKYWLVDDCYENRYGHAILGDMSRARRFNAWMMDTLFPFMGNSILEIGSGIGNMSRLLPKKERLTVTDNDPLYLNLLECAFSNYTDVNVKKLDLNDDNDFSSLDEGGYDTVVCLNVLEHLEDDKAVLMRMRQPLKQGGKLIILVPQFQWLYGSYDKIVGHFRRYDRKRLALLFNECGFEVQYSKGFNFVSMFGWWLNAVVLKRNKMGKIQLKIFDMLVPMIRIAEIIFPLPGLSLIMVGKKSDFPGKK